MGKSPKLGRRGTKHLTPVYLPPSPCDVNPPPKPDCFIHQSKLHRVVITVQLPVGRPLLVSHIGSHSAFPDVSQDGQSLAYIAPQVFTEHIAVPKRSHSASAWQRQDWDLGFLLPDIKPM